jgi:hypothetical protein
VDLAHNLNRETFDGKVALIVGEKQKITHCQNNCIYAVDDGSAEIHPLVMQIARSTLVCKAFVNVRAQSEAFS